MADDAPDVQVGPSEAAAAGSDAGAVVLVRVEVLSLIRQHAAEDLDHELGGVLVGSASSCQSGTVVYIEGAIRAQHTQSLRGSVTFTHETWAQIGEDKEQAFPDRRIIGWYHTHPGFGVFLSDYDLFIHRNFFNLPWQVALVVDPRAETSGVFMWRDGEIVGPAGLEVVHAAAQAPPSQPFTASAPARRGGGLWPAVSALALLLLLLVQIAGLRRAQTPVTNPQTMAAIQAVGQQVSDLRETLAPLTQRAAMPPGEVGPEGYTTEPGDTLKTVALAYYGDEDKWGALAVANGLSGADVPPGTRLRIPGPLAEAALERPETAPAGPASQ